MPGRILIIAVVTIALSPIPGLAAAKVLSNADNGMAERIYSTNGKFLKDEIGFLWDPEMAPGSTSYAVVASCQRANLFDGKFVGNHKATFKKLTIIGTDSETEANLKTKKSTIKKGLPKKYAIWEITSLGKQLAVTDDVVLGFGKVTVSGKVKSGDLVQCFIGLAEVDDSVMSAAATEEQRLEVFEEIFRESMARQHGGRASDLSE